eukprot:1160630-Pelagomonas_calceolata.AAC.9
MAPCLPVIYHVQSFDMLAFMNQNNNKLDPFFHELLVQKDVGPYTLHIRQSILWLLNTVLHCYPGKHGAASSVHECGMVIEKQFEQLLHLLSTSVSLEQRKNSFRLQALVWLQASLFMLQLSCPRRQTSSQSF